ncbi:MAG: hypothetical protein A2725_04220 [Candidatus Magasanikbacteria bacterium RIFCSPHIGHO2_01_FULL_33_34]|uniref:Bacterial type II secretion system protein E domain-containing protein n=1 Tax=Candidatus Magasanikbacteria bacterium RIFCSPHIGHO2_01_FULL_33_34 TaxID=1798671 RepID=A0A1F6LHX5_9BACT|nr:MAG: hypothetical protein A2725_04220 [Candidatus Magasanikbacteria bacterium RIFCSPHIGHO2_01_FULL_33_34]OGH65171.1 MAG: hypothetical protein A3B83_03980 [Candidatus Magasanikbacteria bacterium RIFCSPHIGHO2_02_FULL_33_17]OGH75284.1 MAG: hypothetical protein A3A89_04185 [Candidatus Magasanikbacteria bacterium RIFCSPLOWO2_01_FULL_33_34]OGH81039.1 MAG: hypothetical protein A3F93_00215 [Candidatus Magasanikbacteria bacterium RIFCSPLOWO2_12_FULL_34_7]
MQQLDNKTIGEILLKETYISKKDLENAQKALEKSRGSLVDYLLAEDIISKDLLGQAIAEYYNVMYVDLKQEKIDIEIAKMIPELVAISKRVIPYARTEDGIKVGMLNPNDFEVLNMLEKVLGDNILVFYVNDEDIEDILSIYGPSFKEAFDELYEKFLDPNILMEEKDEISVKLVDIFLEYGYKNRASDIHMEPYSDGVVVRFRIDGVLHDVLKIPNSNGEGLFGFIMSRIKILAKMATDEHKAAQDGKLRYKVGKEVFDVRVSIVPVVHGENIVMRLLSAKGRQFSLSDIGVAEADLDKINLAIKNPHGMILVTGPTGSGKTTTLYSILKILNKRNVNIATIEDPVEYDMEGVSQIQVNKKTDLTFAKGLRALVRQDPDIIMVGEIRDEETASIAVNSALTGHLVLSTLHTNDAATTLPRLLDMGIEPFLVVSTVNVVVAQRLVRKICAKCRVSHNMNTEEKALIQGNLNIKEICNKKGYTDLDKIRLYQGSGCKICGNTGYEGRVGIFEVLDMNEDIKNLILKRASTDEIVNVARKGGMKLMVEDGMEKVFNGITTIQEVLRVTI